jgi:cellulose synthase/poly-beta-1,6-N-acetylglucosamine synthase-like glycosyltransferase
MSFLIILYLLTSIWLSIYGFNAFVLVFLYLKNRKKRITCPPLAEFPLVTVQLPLYNEQNVVGRAIDALSHIDWPRDRLQIQVLDDSTDETTLIAHQYVEQYRDQGLDITLCHREERTGYKAGALNEAMQSARGAFIAMFDADFCPPADFLRRTVPHLLAEPRLGFVQARWGHLNDDFSLLTLAQAIALDGHFVVEHAARERAHLLTNFNGTAGVWRRACIEECGGWDTELLTEDLDLSYRAQMAGWKGLTLTDVVAPAEVPVQLAALKRQQFRWAKGNVQCLLKQGRHLLGAPLPFLTRLQGLLYLSCYVPHALMLFTMCMVLPLIWYGLLDRLTLSFLGLATFGPPLLYVIGQIEIYPRWWQRLKALPILICLGVGLAPNSTVAIIEALLGVRSAFERTPKFQLEGPARTWQNRSYASPGRTLLWGEILSFVCALLTMVVALKRRDLAAVSFLSLYVIGFGFVSLLGLFQACQYAVAVRRRPKMRAQRPAHIPGTIQPEHNEAQR